MGAVLYYVAMFWTLTHVYTLIPTLIVEVIFALVLGHFLKDKPREVKMLPFKILAISLLVLEASNQIYTLATNSWDPYWLPLHFCSLFLYLLPFYAFMNPERKVYKIFESTTISALTLLFFFMVICPNIVVGDGDIQNYFNFSWPLSFHTVTFHYLTTVGFFLVITLKLYPPKLDWKAIIIGFSAYGILEAIFANILQTNYNALLDGRNADFLHAFHDMLVGSMGAVFGQIVYSIAYILIMDACGMICYLLFSLIAFLLGKTKKPKEEEKVEEQPE